MGTHALSTPGCLAADEISLHSPTILLSRRGAFLRKIFFSFFSPNASGLEASMADDVNFILQFRLRGRIAWVYWGGC